MNGCAQSLGLMGRLRSTWIQFYYDNKLPKVINWLDEEKTNRPGVLPLSRLPKVLASGLPLYSAFGS